MSRRAEVFIYLLLSFIIIVVIRGQFTLENNRPINEPKIIQELAFDYDKRLGYTVYIEENGMPEPYYVVTKNYFNQRNVLLVRKYLLEESIQYQDNHNTTTYYATSMPDNFLNTVFIETLSESVKSEIPLTTITIGVEGGGKRVRNGRTPEKIKRQVFLLSDYEVEDRYGRFRDTEIRLPFFREDGFKYRIATLSNGTATYWWLRSVPGGGRSSARGITHDGRFGSQWMIYPGYLRPAFTLPPNTRIRKTKYEGEEIYVLDLDWYEKGKDNE